MWVAVDGVTAATPLALIASGGIEMLQQQWTWTQAFVGAIPGSIGEDFYPGDIARHGIAIGDPGCLL